MASKTAATTLRKALRDLKVQEALNDQLRNERDAARRDALAANNYAAEAITKLDKVEACEKAPRMGETRAVQEVVAQKALVADMEAVVELTSCGREKAEAAREIARKDLGRALKWLWAALAGLALMGALALVGWLR